jgi:putative DNA primase/helicase
MTAEQMAEILGVTMTDDRCATTWALLDKSDPIRDKATGAIVREGRPKPHLANVQTILSNDPKWASAIWRCELRRRVTLHGAVMYDEDEAEVSRLLAVTYGLHTPTSVVSEGLRWMAAKQRRHPVREWLAELKWDGVPRLDRWLTTYCAAPDTQLVRAMGRAWMVQACARAIEPGCKADAVLILKGVQGCRKSTTCAVLGGAWYRDSDLDLSSKDKYQQLEGAWIYELSEMDAMRRADARALKAFVSSQTDSYRPSYGRNTQDVPRSTVFIGTTNDEEFLVDPTGSRRYWVVEVGHCDPEALEADREQLFAEAVAATRAGERWHLSADLDTERASEAERYTPVDSWESAISEWIITENDFTLDELWRRGLGHERSDASKHDDMRMATILRRLGFNKKRRRAPDGSELRAYRWSRG